MIGWLLAAGAAALLAYEAFFKGSSQKPAGGSTPQATGPLGFENPPKFLASPMHLAPGQRYRFRYFESRFDPTSFFTKVHLYASESELPADWPAQTKGAQSADTHFAAGTWAGAVGSFDKPDGLLQVWPTLNEE